MQDICIEVNGSEVAGKVKIEGVRKLKFTVYYDGKEKTDAKDYRTDQKGYLMIMAKQILREMATGRF